MPEKKRILFLCTQNACRSQMAEGLANNLMKGLIEARSAGIRPHRVHPLAIEVLSEMGLDLSGARSKHLDEFSGQEFDLAVTLCSGAKEQCPTVPGAKRLVHFPLKDPAEAAGSLDQRLDAFRKVRDAIISELIPFLKKELGCELR